MRLRLGDFEGNWRLDRKIDDRLAGRTGRLQGEASFEPDGQGLIYREEGTLRFPGAPPLKARQSYLWRAAEAGVEVLFTGGQAFHGIDLTGATPGARHDCAPDVYAVAYDFTAWPEWMSTWSVSGPRKDYTMTSRYRRG